MRSVCCSAATKAHLFEEESSRAAVVAPQNKVKMSDTESSEDIADERSLDEQLHDATFDCRLRKARRLLARGADPSACNVRVTAPGRFQLFDAVLLFCFCFAFVLLCFVYSMLTVNGGYFASRSPRGRCSLAATARNDAQRWRVAREPKQHRMDTSAGKH